jgi:hypothetical protein
VIDLHFGFNFRFKRDKSMDKLYEAIRPGLVERIKRAIYGRKPENKQGGSDGNNKGSGTGKAK